MSKAGEGEAYVLELSQKPIEFEAVTKITNVFYDEVTKQVFTVRSGGATGIIVKGPGLKTPLNFRVEDKGPLLSVKFSPNRKILAVQRSARSVEFLNFNIEGQPEGAEYQQACRGSSSVIQNFVWASDLDLILITNQGLEHYQAIPEKHAIRCIKIHSLPSTNWHVYCPASSLLIVSLGPTGSTLQPFSFRNGQLLRQAKFEVEIGAHQQQQQQQPPRLCLLERDVTPTVLYKRTMVLVLHHHIRPAPDSNLESPGAEVLVYTLTKEAAARKTHVLRTDVAGKSAVSVIDNLVVVHHQASKTSSVFDIGLSGDGDGRVVHLRPFLAGVTIRPHLFDVPDQSDSLAAPMYSPNWVFFQPNTIIDAILGCLWNLELRLAPVLDLVEDPCQLMDFLLERHDSKGTVLNALRRLICSPVTSVDMQVLGRIFDRLNEAYRTHLDIEIQSQIAQPANSALHSRSCVPVPAPPTVVIDQNDFYTRVLSHLTEGTGRPERDRLMVAVVNEYIRSLVQFHIIVQHPIYEILIEGLVRLGQFYQLHQLFQYHAITDSKPLACLLLSLESIYPAAYQLALDMLRRIGTANEEIVEILLSKNRVLSALRFARQTLALESISARKFLEAAQNTQDANIFYGVFHFFQQRNQRLRSSPTFLKGEHCDNYVRHYNTLFNC